MEYDVSFGQLAAAADALTAGADHVLGAAETRPSSVAAGPASALILAPVADLVSTCAALVDALDRTASSVRAAAATYQGADDVASGAYQSVDPSGAW